MKDAELIVAVISLALNTGLTGLLLKMYIQWNEVKERGDILWYHYCKDHNIPFRPTGRGFDDRALDRDRG